MITLVKTWFDFIGTKFREIFFLAKFREILAAKFREIKQTISANFEVCEISKTNFVTNPVGRSDIWTDRWGHGCMDGQTDGQMNGQVYGREDQRMNGWVYMDGWMNGWREGKVNGSRWV